jgi:hypothetical protein
MITDAPKAGINAAHGPNSLANRVGVKRIREMDVVGGGPEFRGQLINHLPTHEALKTQGMVKWEGSTLPIQKFIHLECVNFFPREALTIANFDELKILRHRTYRQYPACRSPVLLVETDLIGHALCEMLYHGRDGGEELNPHAGLLQKALHRHAEYLV